MKKLLLLTGAAAMVALESAAVRTPAASMDSVAKPIDTRIGDAVASVPKEIDSRVESLADSALGELDTFNSPGMSIIFR